MVELIPTPLLISRRQSFLKRDKSWARYNAAWSNLPSHAGTSAARWESFLSVLKKHKWRCACINIGTATEQNSLECSRLQRSHSAPLSKICPFRIAQMHIYRTGQKHRAGLLNKHCGKLQSCSSLLSTSLKVLKWPKYVISQCDRIASEKTTVSVLEHVHEWSPFFCLFVSPLSLLHVTCITMQSSFQSLSTNYKNPVANTPHTTEV